MSVVVKAERNKKGITIHEMDNGTKKTYQDIRGGISWPLMAENLPAYYCIYGEEWVPPAMDGNKEEQFDRRKLCLISEHEAPNILTSLATFFSKLTDDAALYLCDTFYAVTEDFQGEDYRGYAETFQSFIYEKRAYGSLEQALWAERPDLGIYHINAWLSKGLLEIPEGSIIRDQLKMVQAETVKDLPQKLNAVNALRFVVCSFERIRPNNHLIGFTPRRG
jgi:hypothetical protein